MNHGNDDKIEGRPGVGPNGTDDTTTHQPAATPDSLNWQLTDYVSRLVLDRPSDWSMSYQVAQPYPHAVMDQVFHDNFLQACVREIKDHSTVDFKESDLFRVYQSIDLANLGMDQTASMMMPHTLQLRQVLYSETWRHFVEDVCDLPRHTLTTQIDCACNCHAMGGHLLCHDDVIGTRCVSYIVYLTEPDWTAADGGALELYDHETVVGPDDHTVPQPQVVPATTLLPCFNRVVVFQVQPGVSFHAVQEVLTDVRPRLSLQGWYHAAAPPNRSEQATLAQLKKRRRLNSDHDEHEGVQPHDFSFVPIDYGDDATDNGQPTTTTTLLSDRDRRYLADYINDMYLTPSSMAEISHRFANDSSVQLRQFLRSDRMDAIQTAMQREDVATPITDANYYEQGHGHGWQLTGPPHKQRFLRYQENDSPRHYQDNDTTGVHSVGALLRNVQTLLQSPAFGRYLQALTGLGRPLTQRGIIRRFRRGLDYTVAHHGLLTLQSILDATFCSVAGHGQQQADDADDTSDDAARVADMLWQSGDVGGFECYIEADDDKDEAAADEYNSDDDTELLSVAASNNTLSLVYRDPGSMRFVKYVSAQAPSSRYDVAMEYQVEEDEDDDSDSEDNDDNAYHNDQDANKDDDDDDEDGDE